MSEVPASRLLVQTDTGKRKSGIVLGGMGLALFFVSAILMIFLPPDLLAYMVAVTGTGIAFLAVGYITLRRAEADALEHVRPPRDR